jgi:hypothetical protein
MIPISELSIRNELLECLELMLPPSRIIEVLVEVDDCPGPEPVRKATKNET